MRTMPRYLRRAFEEIAEFRNDSIIVAHNAAAGGDGMRNQPLGISCPALGKPDDDQAIPAPWVIAAATGGL